MLNFSPDKDSKVVFTILCRVLQLSITVYLVRGDSEKLSRRKFKLDFSAHSYPAKHAFAWLVAFLTIRLSR